MNVDSNPTMFEHSKLVVCGINTMLSTDIAHEGVLYTNPSSFGYVTI